MSEIAHAPLVGVSLALEASTYAGSVAVMRDGALLAEREVQMRGAHEERLMPAVADALDAAGVATRDLVRVICGEGPGSFTSLRIAASIAKGIAFGRRLPLLAVPSPLLMIMAARPVLGAGRWLAALDAMRDECFVGCYEIDDDGRITTVETLALAARSDVVRLARDLGATTVGPAMTRDLVPHARGVTALGVAIDAPSPVDLSAWEPVYGRLAEAQVKWERAHGRALATES